MIGLDLYFSAGVTTLNRVSRVGRDTAYLVARCSAWKSAMTP